MKKLIALILALCMCALCGCGGNAEETVPTTDVPTTEAATEAVTEAPTENETPTEAAVVYTNPLTGETLDAPMENRIFAFSINNLEAALPHRGVYKADMYFEMFVNGSIIRGLALYTDVAEVESIGSIRSTRPIFIDISQHYDAFHAHAGGSDVTLTDIARAGIDHKNIDTGDRTDYSYRDKTRTGAYEHTLFAVGSGVKAYAENNGYRTTVDPNTNYGLHFTEDGTPAGGENASVVDITFIYNRNTRKDTSMVYDEDLGKYTYNQYGKLMTDNDTQDVEAFENVIVMLGEDHLDAEGYHQFDFLSGGDGYYACGGKIIPIKWSCAGEDQPFTFSTTDGEPLQMGVGSSYIAVAPIGSAVSYK